MSWTKALIVDDSTEDTGRLRTILEDRGFAVSTCGLDPNKRAAALLNPVDVIFVELAPAPEDPISTVVEARAFQPNAVVIVFTHSADFESCLLALRQGAVDYLIKLRDEGVTLLNAIERGIIQTSLVIERERLLVELEQGNERLADLANRDAHTGLYNFRFFWDYASQEIERTRRRGMPLSIIMADIDHFKKINDEHGHRAGDEVLVKLAHAMSQLVRTSDLVARYGGEEFVILLPDTDVDGSKSVANRLRNMISNQIVAFEDRTIAVTVSVGVSVYPEHGTTVEALIRSADRALYRAKAGGRDRIEYAA
jgi:diguanylate cyclase (GGDEF)-like protein